MNIGTIYLIFFNMCWENIKLEEHHKQKIGHWVAHRVFVQLLAVAGGWIHVLPEIDGTIWYQNFWFDKQKPGDHSLIILQDQRDDGILWLCKQHVHGQWFWNMGLCWKFSGAGRMVESSYGRQRSLGRLWRSLVLAELWQGPGVVVVSG